MRGAPVSERLPVRATVRPPGQRTETVGAVDRSDWFGKPQPSSQARVMFLARGIVAECNSGAPEMGVSQQRTPV